MAEPPTYCATPCPAGYAYDTSWKLTSGEAGVLHRAPPPVGVSGAPVALWRYVSLGTPSTADITVAERDAILGAGWLLGLVQHVERPSWQADPATGMAHGAAAVAHARLVGYPAGAHLGLDMEGLGNADAPVMGYVVAWADAVHAAGYRVLMYVGYDDGLSLGAHKALQDGGYVDAWWSDFGQRQLPEGCSWAIQQHAQTTVAGIAVDPDEILAAGAIALMGLDDSVTDEDPAKAAQAATDSAIGQSVADTDPAPPIPIPDTAHADTIPPDAGG